MYERHVLGKLGEDIAVRYLKSKDYNIIERNFECRQGEIDIVAIDKDELVIIEVKTRKCLSYGKPVEAVDDNKQKHIYNVARYYTYIRRLDNMFIRFDIIEVYIKDKKCYINHLRNVILDFDF